MLSLSNPLRGIKFVSEEHGDITEDVLLALQKRAIARFRKAEIDQARLKRPESRIGVFGEHVARVDAGLYHGITAVYGEEAFRDKGFLHDLGKIDPSITPKVLKTPGRISLAGIDIPRNA